LGSSIGGKVMVEGARRKMEGGREMRRGEGREGRIK
jgi:hypothetical protein